jgi:hypothetical protein
MMYGEGVGKHRKLLKRHGLNIFDLLSWENLYNLYVGYRHIYRQGISEDKEGAKKMLKAMWAALDRQAEAYEAEYATDERSMLLHDLKKS